MTELAPENVVVGTARAGGLYVAPYGTTLPADQKEALDAAFLPVGYISEDGVTIGQELETEDLNAWQSASPIRKIVTSRVVSVEFTMVEVNKTVLGLYWGEDEATDTAGDLALTINSTPKLPEYSVVVDVQDGDRIKRFVAGRAQLSDSGEQEVTRTGAIGFPATLSTLDDAGVLGYEYVGAAA